MKNIKYIILFIVLVIFSGHNKLTAQNKSLLFNGTDNKVVVENHPDFDFDKQFTLEAWIYANSWKDQAWQGSVINKDADYGGTQTGYNMRIGAGGRLEGIITPGWEGAITGAVMKTQKWNHVAMVFKEGEMWLYINGTQQAYKGGLPDSINTSPVDLLIGECPGFPGRVWDGRIDEVRIWDTARSAAEIQQNMSASLTGTEKGLVAYYNFDEDDSSDTLTDRTGNGHVGTLQNFGSEYTWTTGYELSENDIAVTRIINPGNNPAWSMEERIKIEVKNTAFNNVSNFNVVFEYDGQEYTETVTQTIEPWQTYVHTFNKFLDLRNKEEVTITASVSWEADTDEDNNMLEETFERSSTIRLMERVQHNFGDKGQLQNNVITLPDDNSGYSQLLLHISVACPSTGCDPWDQAGYVNVKKDDKEYEIGRFITPYNKACGPWTIDVSDFRSVLTGTVDVISFIQVWGTSGWLLTLDLEYVEGEVEKPFTKVIPLYEIDYQVYGDPAISYDLPEQTVGIPANTQLAHIRMTNTGHGQANTNNAAEFMEANHHMWVNGIDKFTHHLWKDDCDQNSCSPQNGTWQYARAGWCPGQQVNPFWMNITDVLTPGDDMVFDYVLQEYTNLLNTGYNGGSHTEPFYKIYSYLYLASDSPFENYTDLAIDSVNIIEGETAGTHKIYLELANKGSSTVENAEIGYVINNADATVEATTLSLEPGATMAHEFEISGFDDSQPGLLVVFADTENDQVSSNNSRAIGFGGYTKTVERMVQPQVKVYPNPVEEIVIFDSEFAIQNIRFQSVDGKVIREVHTNNKKVTSDLFDFDPGIYIVFIELMNNQIHVESIVKK